MSTELAKAGRLKVFSTQALANSIWAFATLRYMCDEECWAALTHEIEARVSFFKEQVPAASSNPGLHHTH